jgi:hypothetical protein
VGEALVEAADHIEDEGAVRDDLPEGVEVIGCFLEAMTILNDGEVSLDEVVEPRFKLDGAYFPVPEELGLDGEPDVSDSVSLGGDDLGEVIGEGVEDPGLDYAIHPIPIQRGNRGVKVDVIL